MLFDPQAWGLSPEAIQGLGQRLHQFWQRYAVCFKSRTRDASRHALDYLSGLLRMTTERNFTAIGRTSGQAGQNVQHFMSNAPWSAQVVLAQVRQEIAANTQFAQGSMLLLDESADEKASTKTVGAGRQHNGRLGKVEMSQVGTFLAYVHGSLWTWIDGELFLPEHWFEQSMAAERQRLGVPANRQFATKIELGWQMIQRVAQEGVPFEAVGCDTLYGRNTWLRRQMHEAGLVYMADVPADTLVYLRRPVIGVPVQEPGRKGRACQKARVLSDDKPVAVRALAASPDTVWRSVCVRATERGELRDEFSAQRVWTAHAGEEPVQEWLVLRRGAEGKSHFALSNAPEATPLERLSWMQCQRHFIECANRDAKSEAGWDELRAQKFAAWEHHLALTVLATWFVAQTKYDWVEQFARAPELGQQWQVEGLPQLSMANVRELLRAVMPLPQLTPAQATELVVEHLVNRVRSRKSRMKKRHQRKSP